MMSLRALLQSERAIQLTNAVILVLAVWIGVSFVWSFWPQQDSFDTTGVTPITQTSKEFNLSKVLDSELFGSTTEVAAPVEQITAPVTRLKLKLRGVFLKKIRRARVVDNWAGL